MKNKLLLLCSCLLSLMGAAQTQIQIGGDIDGGAVGDRSGQSVCLSGDGSIIAIGAPFNGGNGTNSGQVRLYRYTTDGTWTQIGGDIDGEAAGDFSGWSVSLSGDGETVAIGAPYNDGNGANSGQVRLYRNMGGTWTQIGGDIDGVAGDQSGYSVSLSGDGTIVAIGAPNNGGNGPGSGQVRIYRNMNGAWTPIGDIDGEAASDQSGESVSLSADGTTVAIGALYNVDNGADSGQVRLYRNMGGTWTQIGGDIDGEANDDQSGTSVSLSGDGDTVAIGAPFNAGNGANSGQVRLYRYTDGTWARIGGDIDGEAAGDYSGTSVSLSADGNTVAIGAPFNAGNGGANSGQVRLYRNTDGAWTRIGDDIDGEAAGDYSGTSVSLSGDGSIIAIGAPFNDGNGGVNSGQVRVFLTYDDPNAFITTWRTTTANETIVIPTKDSGYNYTVVWGDGTTSINQTGDASHTYVNAGDYKVSIIGEFPRIFFEKTKSSTSGNNEKIIGIDQWGTSPWTSMDSAFEGCGNLQGNFTDVPDLSHVTSMGSMFFGASSFNGVIGDWDVSKVTDMGSMFYGASSFKGDIGDWDVSSVETMEAMFREASSFDGDLSKWGVSNVVNMRYMFYGASSFNGDIGDWDVSKVTNMRFMFYGASSFNGAIGNWDVSNVVNMESMFREASSFDRDLGSWKVSKVTSMGSMFEGVALSVENYDGLLLGWSAQELQPNVAFDAGDSAYCRGGDARQSMVGQFNWGISDAGRLDVDVQELADQEASGYFTFPEINGKNLGDTKAFYTEPDGQGDKFDSGDEIGFERFESYPVTLYAYYKTTGGCSDQESFQLTIVPLQQEGLEFADGSFIYDGTEKSLAVTGMALEAEVSYQNNGKTGAGTYEVTATVSLPNYEDAVLRGTMTIDKAASVITSDPVQSFTYDGSQQNVVAVLNHGETALEYTPEQGYTDVGEYSITINAAETANYLAASKEVNLVIQAADQEELEFADGSFTYDGTEKSLAVTGMALEAEVSYQNNGKTGAGTYEVTATVSRPGSVDIVLHATLTIGKADQSIWFEEIDPMHLGEEDRGFQLEGTATSGLAVRYTYTYAGDQASAVVTPLGFVTLLGSGSIEITADQAGNENYQAAAPVTRTLRIRSSDAGISSLYANGSLREGIDDDIYYLIDCVSGQDSVSFELVTEPNATSTSGMNFTISAPRPGIYRKEVGITSEDGTQTRNYHFTVERRFGFDDIVVQKFNNTLAVNNNPDTNGGYSFASYEWFKDGVSIGSGQYYSAGDTANDLLDPMGTYEVVLTTVDGDVMQSCPDQVELKKEGRLYVVSNPVTAGGTAHVIADFDGGSDKDMSYSVYSLQGVFIKKIKSTGRSTPLAIDPGTPPGVYILIGEGELGNHSFKFIVR